MLGNRDEKYILCCCAIYYWITPMHRLERVEPPFWWEDMKESKLQLLIYGKNISQYQPEMSGVNIVEVTRTENPNYLFVTIDTEGLTAGMYVSI